MRLKKIKPGTVICCKNNAEWNELEDHFENMGWDERDYIRRLDHSTVIHIDGFNEVRWENKSNIVNGSDITYFSDLIIPELTAAEVLRICNEMCHNGAPCSDCKIAGNCFFEKDSDYQKVVEICEKWKADHEKKEPEFEWVDICRIIQVHDGGKKECVHEEDISEHWKELTVEVILKDYITTHEGNYIAVVEHVCRVKGEK